MKESMKKVITFLIINFLLSSVFYYLSSKGGMNILVNLGLMWVPALSSIVTQLMYNKTVKGLGWKLGNAKYLLMSALIPLMACLVVYGSVWITKIGGVSLNRLTQVYHRPIGTVMVIISTVLFLFNLFAALGEEIGWRGFLTAELLKNYSYVKTSVICAFIWFAWHCPMVILSGYHAKGTPMWYNLIVLVICTTAFTFITVWIKVKSGSLWTAAVFHACHNMLSQQVFDVITIDYGKTKYITSEFGVGLALFYVICAVVCIFDYDKGRKREQGELITFSTETKME